MSVGKTVRLNRLFSAPSGRLCSVAIDHFVMYDSALPQALRKIRPVVEAIVHAQPDGITMHKGLAASLWEPYAGRVSLILQCSLARIDDALMGRVATPEEGVCLGADALAAVAFLNGPSEADYLRAVARLVRKAARYEMPVMCHAYPRIFPPDGTSAPQISYAPEDVARAVRCVVELGVDVVKAPYCGNVAAFAEIVDECPVPLVAAGGPKCPSEEAFLGMMADIVRAGGRGAVIGRNVWASGHITGSIRALKAVIHESEPPEEAVRWLQE